MTSMQRVTTPMDPIIALVKRDIMETDIVVQITEKGTVWSCSAHTNRNFS